MLKHVQILRLIIMPYLILLMSCPTSLSSDETTQEGKPDAGEGKVAAPIFSPTEGTYSSDQEVKISCDTEGSVIYYTINGGTPSEGSTKYLKPIMVSGHGTVTTIKAFARKSGMTDSEVATAKIAIDYTIVSTPQFSPPAGIYNGPQSVSITSTPGASIRYTTDGSDPTEDYGTKYAGTALLVSNAQTIKAVGYKSGMQSSTIAAAAYSFDTVAPIGEIRNVKEFGRLESGTLIGIASDNDQVAKVEVSLDSGIYEIASGTTAWSCRLPSGPALTAQASHSVSVRITDRAGNSTYVNRSFDKGINRDFDGDGYADLAVGAYSEGSYGTVRIFRGGPDGPEVTAAQKFSSLLNHDFHSYIRGCGDFNGDGFADLVVRGGDTYQRCAVIYGSAAGLTGTARNVASGYLETWFSSFAVGDLNGDGYDELVIGRYGVAGEAGSVSIHCGSSAGLEGVSTLSGIAAGDRFGAELAIGDVNRDGYADLAVSAPGTSSNRGRVFVYAGSAAGVQGIAATLAPTSSSGNLYFGDSLLCADVNGNGYADLLVSERIGYGNRSYIYAYNGSPSGIPTTAFMTSSDPISDRKLLFSGNVNGDLYQDVAISTGGALNICYGGPGGIDPSGPSRTYDIGAADFGDLNGDGYADLARCYNQMVIIHRGSASGLSGSPDVSISGAHESFGSSLVN